ncbi:protein PALS2 isoform X5 [Palaemon carinicauda]|uniref:protein PALS2 isoform X5 n=1 Tax=Palaemon carinicauda TaxID=392227 RepID=UPI0035B59428
MFNPLAASLSSRNDGCKTVTGADMNSVVAGLQPSDRSRNTRGKIKNNNNNNNNKRPVISKPNGLLVSANGEGTRRSSKQFARSGRKQVTRQDAIQDSNYCAQDEWAEKTALAAYEHVVERMGELNGTADAHHTDLLFLKGLMDSPIMKSLVKVQDTLEDGVGVVEPVSSGSSKLVSQIRILCEGSTSSPSQELADLLQRPHLLALLETHDTIADCRHTGILGNSSNSYTGINGCHDNATFMPEENGYPVDAIRMVGLRKKADEPLGLTVREDENGYLVIARIMAGGSIDKQGLLHVGDAICEVNGVEVTSLQELHQEVAKCRDSVTLKVLPALHDPPAGNQVTSSLHPDATRTICYMRALYSYDPAEDTLLPTCPSQTPEDIGLKFEKGDILQIVDQSDPNWWQAQVVGSASKRTGLIPSQELEERRKAFVRQEYDYVHKIGICGTRISKRKKKLMFSTKKSTDFDQAELVLYEEVARMPPFMRKTLVLIGSHGVGRRTLKNRIIASDPSRFGTTIPHTSRPMREHEEDGKAYHFTTREAMEADIRHHGYLEYGELSGNLYGTKCDSILSIIRSGKMCVLDCSPPSLKYLRNSSELLPYVIFLAAPGMDQIKNLYNIGNSLCSSSRNLTFDRNSSMRYSSRRARTLESLASLYEEDDFKRTMEESAKLQRAYDKYFDLVIINNDLNDTYNQILEAIERLSTEPQWVPVTWVY